MSSNEYEYRIIGSQGLFYAERKTKGNPAEHFFHPDYLWSKISPCGDRESCLEYIKKDKQYWDDFIVEYIR